MPYETTSVPDGDKITRADAGLKVPDRPIMPFIRGDGTGPDIWAAAVAVFDASVEKAYAGKRKIAWMEVFAGETAFRKFKEWLPDETVGAFREFLIGIKGPLTTPVGGGIRSLNVALRQMLDLYVCLRPVRYFAGVPSPVRQPQKVDMVIFRENTEDIYAGIEYLAESDDANKVIEFLQNEMNVKNIRFPATSAIGVKPVSREGTERLVRAAINYALEKNRRSVTLVHKGNIMKFTEGAFRDWGYAIAAKDFRDETVSERESWILGNREASSDISLADNARAVEPGYDLMPEERQKEVLAEVEQTMNALWESHGSGKWKEKLLIRDAIADITLQQVLTRAKSFDVIATLNLNGDYISDALAAQIGGIGIAPGGNINYLTGHAIFEATHGTAPKYADQDKVNPGSVILSGVLMFQYMKWNEVADLIESSIQKTIAQKRVTYDFERLMEGATKLKTSEFASAMIENM